MRAVNSTSLVTVMLVLFSYVFVCAALAQGAGNEWEALCREVRELHASGDYDRATIAARKALEVAEQSVGPEHPDVGTSLNNLAELYRAQGQYAGAEPLYERSLAIREKALGPEHPYVAAVLGNLVALYRATERDNEATELEERIANIREGSR